MLFGPYNNRFSGVPTKPPAAPVITGDGVVSPNQASLSGTSVPEVRVDIHDRGRLLGAVERTAAANGSSPRCSPKTVTIHLLPEPRTHTQILVHHLEAYRRTNSRFNIAR